MAMTAVAKTSTTSFTEPAVSVRVAPLPRQVPADREQMQVEALGDEAAEPVPGLEHDRDRDHAQDDEIPRAVIGEQLAQPEIDQHADDRALERADAADHHHEDHN